MKTMLYGLLAVIWSSIVLAAINSSPNPSGVSPTPATPNATPAVPGVTQPSTSVNTNQNSWNSDLYGSTNRAPANAMTNQPNSMVGSNSAPPAWSNQTPPIVGTNQLSPGEPIPMNPQTAP